MFRIEQVERRHKRASSSSSPLGTAQDAQVGERIPVVGAVSGNSESFDDRDPDIVISHVMCLVVLFLFNCNNYNLFFFSTG